MNRQQSLTNFSLTHPFFLRLSIVDLRLLSYTKLHAWLRSHPLQPPCSIDILCSLFSLRFSETSTSVKPCQLRRSESPTWDIHNALAVSRLPRSSIPSPRIVHSALLELHGNTHTNRARSQLTNWHLAFNSSAACCLKAPRMLKMGPNAIASHNKYVGWVNHKRWSIFEECNLNCERLLERVSQSRQCWTLRSLPCRTELVPETHASWIRRSCSIISCRTNAKDVSESLITAQPWACIDDAAIEFPLIWWGISGIGLVAERQLRLLLQIVGALVIAMSITHSSHETAARWIQLKHCKPVWKIVAFQGREDREEFSRERVRRPSRVAYDAY